MHTIRMQLPHEVSIDFICSTYLKTFQKRKTLNRKLSASHLKDSLEHHLHKKIPLNVFIDAAKKEGFIVKEEKNEVFLNVSHGAEQDIFEIIDIDERNRMIAEAAYYEAEHRGFKPGLEWSDWLIAEHTVDAMLSSLH